MKKFTLITAVFMSLLLAAVAFASAPRENKCSCNEKSQGFHHEAIWKKLNLSNEQKTKIEAIRTAAHKELRPIRENMFDKSVELRRLWLQANPDKEKILAAQAELRKLRDQMGDKITAMRFEIRQILTPDQNEKLANSHWGKGKGYGPRGGNRGQKAYCPGDFF